MKVAIKILLVFLQVLGGIGLSVIAISILIVICLWGCERCNYWLPTEQQVRADFESHRGDYIQFAMLLRQDTTAKHVDGEGNVYSDNDRNRMVPEYRDLAHKLGVKDVLLSDDGSMEFVLGGLPGLAISDESDIGVRYSPKDIKKDPWFIGWKPILVTSLESSRLPQDKGGVATGLYVVEIEPEWFIYRFEYQE